MPFFTIYPSYEISTKQSGIGVIEFQFYVKEDD
jgi:hypothetical protein